IRSSGIAQLRTSSDFKTIKCNRGRILGGKDIYGDVNGFSVDSPFGGTDSKEFQPPKTLKNALPLKLKKNGQSERIMVM
ncbi:MAG: hypothetical protein J6Y48_05190, partial [Clostridia bacterium]|nr:hypothetical protein [Clostridia bacterium]